MQQARTYDLVVVGGGINGVGIARDAAGRGLDVLLCEANDLGGATSSASSKLIHGGLRYLEHYEFALVRKALVEREVLLAIAPHIVWPLRFILPHTPELRSRWMIRAGLFLYDHLARRRTIQGSRAVSLDTLASAGGLRDRFRHGFAYWDCWVDDARLVVLNARCAANRKATVLPRTRLEHAALADGLWQIDFADTSTGALTRCTARAIVNAGGPWADKVLARIGGNRADLAPPALRLVKGSHIVVPRVLAGDDAFILQNDDGRIVFVLPYEDRFSLIGTTDVPFTGDPREAAASDDEIDYLLAVAARFLAAPLDRRSIVHTFAGVRPLHDEVVGKAAQTASRDYHIDERLVAGAGPILSVFGGKITTYRQLSETVVDRLAQHFPGLGPSWTAREALPGGALDAPDFDSFVAGLARRRPGFGLAYLTTLARRHGSLSDDVLGDAADQRALGRHIGASLYEREVAYLRTNEWAQTADDILWRRTKVGLHLEPSERAAAVAFLEDASWAK